MPRTDIHRPSAIEPADYAFVGCEYVPEDGIAQHDRDLIAAHMARTGGRFSQHEHGGNCHVCGAHCIYTAVFHHAPTNTYIRTGFDCADKLDMGDADRFRAFKAGVKSALELKAGRRKAEAFCSEHGLAAAWAIFCQGDAPEHEYEEHTLAEMVGKLVRYGDLSEKQIAFARTLLDRIADRTRIAAERAAERERAEDCPTGRVVIEGVVIKAESRDSAFKRGGSVLKITIKTDAGWVVWGTAPEILTTQAMEAERAAFDAGQDVPRTGRSILHGKRVRLTAAVTRSEGDPKFGFFKRPTGAVLVQEQEAA